MPEVKAGDPKEETSSQKIANRFFNGDFAMVDSFFIPLFISLTTAFYILSYIYYRKSGQMEIKKSK